MHFRDSQNRTMARNNQKRQHNIINLTIFPQLIASSNNRNAPSPGKIALDTQFSSLFREISIGVCFPRIIETFRTRERLFSAFRIIETYFFVSRARCGKAGKSRPANFHICFQVFPRERISRVEFTARYHAKAFPRVFPSHSRKN